jgi:hypothetical protein
MNPAGASEITLSASEFVRQLDKCRSLDSTQLRGSMGEISGE